ncbi:hypothetical protein SDRG_03435 [Saprolegnia diclina VS20]|uniref:Uncharacterized protein n=1 Tax=Saprolegnia diclina (strain VS20) TaxID=1156394 RepID=T0QYR9_SAPDV|nr:hypothetical protein SDRG_03435 [Saprolegnia diclina VS20]EQC39230.1 hypothetical protein SDRG_03435 [Saprolegnia diclina VS20]|eukprot:XP_008607291.1 hypothetical protein SDRG_03435 [Saprolegnia diclina VS20]
MKAKQCANPLCDVEISNPYIHYCDRWMCQQYRGVMALFPAAARPATTLQREVPRGAAGKRPRAFDDDETEEQEMPRQPKLGRRSNRIIDDSDDSDADDEMEAPVARPTRPVFPAKEPAPKPRLPPPARSTRPIPEPPSHNSVGKAEPLAVKAEPAIHVATSQLQSTTKRAAVPSPPLPSPPTLAPVASASSSSQSAPTSAPLVPATRPPERPPSHTQQPTAVPPPTTVRKLNLHEYLSRSKVSLRTIPPSRPTAVTDAYKPRPTSASVNHILNNEEDNADDDSGLDHSADAATDQPAPPTLCAHGRATQDFCQACVSARIVAVKPELTALCAHSNLHDVCPICSIPPALDRRLSEAGTAALCPHGGVSTRHCAVCQTTASMELLVLPKDEACVDGASEGCGHFQPETVRGPCRVCGAPRPDTARAKRPPHSPPSSPLHVAKRAHVKDEGLQLPAHRADAAVPASQVAIDGLAPRAAIPPPVADAARPVVYPPMTSPRVVAMPSPPAVVSPPLEGVGQSAPGAQSAAFIDDDDDVIGQHSDDDDDEQDVDGPTDLPSEPIILSYSDRELYSILWFFSVKLTTLLGTMKQLRIAHYNCLSHFRELVKELKKASVEIQLPFEITCVRTKGSVRFGPHTYLELPARSLEDAHRVVLLELYLQATHWALLSKQIQLGKVASIPDILPAARTMAMSTKYARLPNGDTEYVHGVLYFEVGRATAARLADAKTAATADAWARLHRICMHISPLYRPDLHLAVQGAAAPRPVPPRAANNWVDRVDGTPLSPAQPSASYGPPTLDMEDDEY